MLCIIPSGKSFRPAARCISVVMDYLIGCHGYHLPSSFKNAGFPPLNLFCGFAPKPGSLDFEVEF